MCQVSRDVGGQVEETFLSERADVYVGRVRFLRQVEWIGKRLPVRRVRVQWRHPHRAHRSVCGGEWRQREQQHAVPADGQYQSEVEEEKHAKFVGRPCGADDGSGELYGGEWRRFSISADRDFRRVFGQSGGRPERRPGFDFRVSSYSEYRLGSYHFVKQLSWREPVQFLGCECREFARVFDRNEYAVGREDFDNLRDESHWRKSVGCFECAFPHDQRARSGVASAAAHRGCGVHAAEQLGRAYAFWVGSQWTDRAAGGSAAGAGGSAAGPSADYAGSAFEQQCANRFKFDSYRTPGRSVGHRDHCGDRIQWTGTGDRTCGTGPGHHDGDGRCGGRKWRRHQSECEWAADWTVRPALLRLRTPLRVSEPTRCYGGSGDCGACYYASCDDPESKSRTGPWNGAGAHGPGPSNGAGADRCGGRCVAASADSATCNSDDDSSGAVRSSGGRGTARRADVYIFGEFGSTGADSCTGRDGNRTDDLRDGAESGGNGARAEHGRTASPDCLRVAEPSWADICGGHGTSASGTADSGTGARWTVTYRIRSGTGAQPAGCVGHLSTNEGHHGAVQAAARRRAPEQPNCAAGR